MGYSKYTEDIVDRWVEETRDREDAFYRQWNLEHVPAPPPMPGDVYLEIAGKRLEDEEVFPTGKGIKFRAIVNKDAAPLQVLVRRGHSQSELRADAAENYVLPAPNPETVDIDASSGAYHRRYTLHFVEVTQIDRIEALAEEISRFTSNPPGWTQEQFDLFRNRLREVLTENAVPQSFANGLVEYFLGVQLEANGDRRFSQRLETDFVILRRFAPFSDIAAVISEYFRYRTNTFPAANHYDVKQHRPFGRIMSFFVASDGEIDDSAGTKGGIELVVPEVEYSCLEAVRAMIRHEPVAALGMAAVSRKLNGAIIDPQREERLKLIEARANVRLGDSSKARIAYQGLLTSPCSLFQNEAYSFLQR